MKQTGTSKINGSTKIDINYDELDPEAYVPYDHEEIAKIYPTYAAILSMGRRQIITLDNLIKSVEDDELSTILIELIEDLANVYFDAIEALKLTRNDRKVVEWCQDRGLN